MAQGLGNNTANMGIMAMHWWAKYEPALEWDTIIFVVDDAGTQLKALHGMLWDEINTHMKNHGVKIVHGCVYGNAESYVNSQHSIMEIGRVPGKERLSHYQ